MKKILIIDDDPEIVEYLEALFKDNGYISFSAKNSEEGFEIVKREIPDLITLDLDLPDEWGPRFYRKLTKSKELKHIPVIVISGLTGNEHAIGRAIACLTKPFDRDKLISIVKKTLE